jgi:hypothetical protein
VSNALDFSRLVTAPSIFSAPAFDQLRYISGGWKTRWSGYEFGRQGMAAELQA